MTYSIVARDKKTGQLGIAVQTHWFGVGNNVPWLESGVGAIATQAQTNMDYGKIGLQLLKKGKNPEEVIKNISQKDVAFESRQVAIIDASGNISAHTGEKCIKYAGYLIGDNFVVQGNILTNEKVLPAMKQAYEENENKDFSTRLSLSLKAGEQAGGELRGVQSAALRIVGGKKDEYDIINLRIDDHEKPLEELLRQIQIQKAYNYLNEAEEEGTVGSLERSGELFSMALEIIPESEEFLFWKAFMFKNRGKTKDAEKIFLEHFSGEEKWKELWNRIK